MRRVLLLLGPVIATVGAIGLVKSGGAIVGILDVLVLRVSDPPEPLPTALADLQFLALSGMALAIGLSITCCATVICGSKQAMSKLGRVLYTLAGVLLVVGVVAILCSIMVAKQSFWIMANSTTTPRPENVKELIQSTAPTITIGCQFFVAATLALLLSGRVGFQAKLTQSTRLRSVLSIVAVANSVVFGVIVSLFFMLIWFHGNALEVLLTDASMTPKPAELAGHLVGVLNKSLLAFAGFAVQAVMQVVAAVFAPTSQNALDEPRPPGHPG